MKYIIKQETDTQTVIIEASGIISTEVAEEMVLAAGLKLNYTDFQKCLFDLTNTELDPKQKMVEMFMFVEVFTKAKIDKSVKMAALIDIKDEFRLRL